MSSTMMAQSAAIPAGPPVFKFSRDTYSVRVENIPESVGRHEIKELFCNLIGEVRRCEERISDEQGRFMELTFYTRDASKKALCMTGYTVAGVPLRVTALSPPCSNRLVTHARQMDGRRNLYVLGLPFDLTKSEFMDYFSRYGTVTHCVILATVDNASRRRGFVVMSSHDEAKAAMAALSRTEMKGHTVDVSWAVVQRSQGFLDGGDRAVALSNRTPSPSGIQETATRAPTPDTPSIAIMAPAAPAPPLVASTLLVTNLPTLLFSQTIDLQPLFCPFGDIKRLEILQATPADMDAGKLSVIVEYSAPQSAKEAMQSLHGQVYAGFRVDSKLIDTPAAASPTAASSPFLSSNAASPSSFHFSVTPSSPQADKRSSAALSRGWFGRELGNMNTNMNMYPDRQLSYSPYQAQSSGFWPPGPPPLPRPASTGRSDSLSGFNGGNMLYEQYGYSERPSLRSRWSSMPNVFDGMPNQNIQSSSQPPLLA